MTYLKGKNPKQTQHECGTEFFFIFTIVNKTRLLSFRADLAKLRDTIMNNTENGEEVESIFGLLKFYPELYVGEEKLPDLVLKTRQRNTEAESLKQKLKDTIQGWERFKDFTGIVLILHDEETCMNPLRELDSAERDAKTRLVYISCLQGQVLKRLN